MKWFNSLVQALKVRLYSSSSSSARDKQRGASALEYIVLAAVIVIVVAAGAGLLGGDESGPIYETFQKIESKLTDTADKED